MTDNKSSFEKSAGEFLKTEQGKKLAAQRPALERLAASEDGKRVRERLGGDKIEAAAKSGDVSALASAVTGALKTEEGARLMEKLRELMK